MSRDLDTLIRWVDAGGEAVDVAGPGQSLIVSLCRCDGGEEVERYATSESDVREWFTRRERLS